MVLRTMGTRNLSSSVIVEDVNENDELFSSYTNLSPTVNSNGGISATTEDDDDDMYYFDSTIVSDDENYETDSNNSSITDYFSTRSSTGGVSDYRSCNSSTVTRPRSSTTNINGSSSSNYSSRNSSTMTSPRTSTTSTISSTDSGSNNTAVRPGTSTASYISGSSRNSSTMTSPRTSTTSTISSTDSGSNNTAARPGTSNASYISGSNYRSCNCTTATTPETHTSSNNSSCFNDEHQHELQPGDQVKIVGGTYKGKNGTFVRYTEKRTTVMIYNINNNGTNEERHLMKGNFIKLKEVQLQQQQLQQQQRQLHQQQRELQQQQRQLQQQQRQEQQQEQQACGQQQLQQQKLQAGSPVKIIGGKYEGKCGTFVRHTEQKIIVMIHNIDNNGSNEERCLMKCNVVIICELQRGDLVKIIGGKYKGKNGTFVRHTEQKTFVMIHNIDNNGSNEERCIMKSNVVKQ